MSVLSIGILSTHAQVGLRGGVEIEGKRVGLGRDKGKGDVTRWRGRYRD